MQTPLWLWIDFNACILIVLAIDLFGFQRKAHVPSAKEAATRTLVWILLSLGLNALIWRWDGHARLQQGHLCHTELATLSFGIIPKNSAAREDATPGKDLEGAPRFTIVADPASTQEI